MWLRVITLLLAHPCIAVTAVNVFRVGPTFVSIEGLVYVVKMNLHELRKMEKLFINVLILGALPRLCLCIIGRL
jgi:hypothetical protein